ncbi:Pkinase-domain-containing protein [Wallemia mellicola]|uniref:Pkinase-domain-containing protein n=1 Tax=Wallemia mellicola TaxID=1708541 RepID=A0A4T0NZD0_9BASI|nr:Pkinase-domain-containing protein [Wallemia mellicola]TIB87952.1 Pkinase-domain-containing protein [Wallemia mellicola]TIB93191.1 Pkinase-domain-containing protein [Wallemia mellicola]TIB99599.1 Pkinase-domain-containing protein [Wallemia mellicola]TIC02458.1 Pkinase-domain-containing protein [Wallemia mellicola]
MSNKSPKKSSQTSQHHPETIGPWQLLKTIGKGRVKLAKHRKSHQLAAIKIVAKSSLAPKQSSNHDDPWRALRAIEREIAVMKIIDHPNITSLYDVWETTDYIYMIMEYASGGELFSHLVERAKKNAARAKPGQPPPSRALPPDEALRLFQQLMYAVNHVHNLALCHRDLKPENILLAKDRQTIKLADFGMATLAGEDIVISKRKTKKGRKLLKTSCGSPHYASPEVVQGKPYVGHMADVWSCGVILFALLTGRLPFHDENLHVLLSKVKLGKFEMPHELDGPTHANARDLLLRMLTSDPSERITMPEILKHPYFTRLPPPIPMSTDSIPAALLPSTSSQKSRMSFQSDQLSEYNESLQRFSEEITDIDDEIFSSIRVLCQSESEETIRSRLTTKGYTIEKRLYLLLERFRDRRSLEELAQMEAGASDESRAWERNQDSTKNHRQPAQLQVSKPAALGERSMNTPLEPVKRQPLSENNENYNPNDVAFSDKNRPKAPTPHKARKPALGEVTNENKFDENENIPEYNLKHSSIESPMKEDQVLRANSVRTASKRLPLESSTDTLDTKIFKKPNTQIEESPHFNFPMDTPSSSFAASIAASIGHVDIAAGGLIPVANENFNPPSISSDRMGRSRFSGASSISFNRKRSIDSKHQREQQNIDDSPVLQSIESPLRNSNVPLGNRTLRKKPAPAPLKVDLFEFQKPFQIVLDDDSGVESDDSGNSNHLPPRPISKSVSGQRTPLSDNLPLPPPLPPKSALETNSNGNTSKTKQILRTVKSFDHSSKHNQQPNRKPSLFGLRFGGPKNQQPVNSEDDNKSFKLNIFSPSLLNTHKHSKEDDQFGISPTNQSTFIPVHSAPPNKQEFNDTNIPDVQDDLNIRRDTLPFVTNQQTKRKSSLGNLFKLSRTRSSSIVNPATPKDYSDPEAFDNNLKTPKWFGGLFQPKTASPLKSTFVSSNDKVKSKADMAPVEHLSDELQPPVNPFKKTVRRTRSVISQLTVHNN